MWAPGREQSDEAADVQSENGTGPTACGGRERLLMFQICQSIRRVFGSQTEILACLRSVVTLWPQLGGEHQPRRARFRQTDLPSTWRSFKVTASPGFGPGPVLTAQRYSVTFKVLSVRQPPWRSHWGLSVGGQPGPVQPGPDRPAAE